MPEARPVCRRLGPAAVAALCLVAWGCGASVDPPGRLGDPAAIFGKGVCGLLAEEELELALNAPLDPGGNVVPTGDSPPGSVETPGGGGAGGGTGGGEPRPMVVGMDMCAREGQGEARATWGVLTEAEQRGEAAKDARGAQDENGGDAGGGQEAADPEGEQAKQPGQPVEALFERYADWHGDYLDRVEVKGHSAVWDPRLQTLLVHADDRLIGVTLTVPAPGAGDAGAYLQRQARDLAARILGRL